MKLAIDIIVAVAEIVDHGKENPHHTQDDDGKEQQQQQAKRVVAAYLRLHSYVLHAL